MRYLTSLSVLLLLACMSAAQMQQPVAAKATTDSPEAVSGKQTFMQYCASCHGENAKGAGPAASALKTPPANLTTLAKHNAGKFPYEYVAGVIRFGKPIAAHGSLDMPVWGPIFSMVDFHEVAIQRRIKNLCEFLASVQEK
jgi:mono/diheme cytochrome c family protein